MFTIMFECMIKKCAQLIGNKMIFSFLDHRIGKCSDDELIRWYISYMNGVDYSEPLYKCWGDYFWYCVFWNEVPKRCGEFQAIIEQIDSVL